MFVILSVAKDLFQRICHYHEGKILRYAQNDSGSEQSSTTQVPPNGTKPEKVSQEMPKINKTEERLWKAIIQK